MELLVTVFRPFEIGFIVKSICFYSNNMLVYYFGVDVAF